MMSNSTEVISFKIEPSDFTSPDDIEAPKMVNVKQEYEYLLNSEIDIKTEPYEHKNEFSTSEAFSSDINYENTIKSETIYFTVKLEYPDLKNNDICDPSDIVDQPKVERQTSSDYSCNLGNSQSDDVSDNFVSVEEDKSCLINKHVTIVNPDQKPVQEKCNNKKRYACNLCDKTYKTQFNLMKHAPIHTTEEYSNTCDICNKLFKSKLDFTEHRTIHGEKPYICEICNKSFKLKSLLNKHRVVHSGEKPFTCDICNKSFLKKCHLASHNVIHTQQRTLFECDICNKSFTSKYYLSEHAHVHTGERPYICEVCNKSFRVKSLLVKHKQIHTRERHFFCNFCRKSFLKIEELNVHKCSKFYCISNHD